MTINEIRRLENMPPIAGGDELNKAAPTAAPDPVPDPATARFDKSLTAFGEAFTALANKPAPAAPVVNVSPAEIHNHVNVPEQPSPPPSLRAATRNSPGWTAPPCASTAATAPAPELSTP